MLFAPQQLESPLLQDWQCLSLPTGALYLNQHERELTQLHEGPISIYCFSQAPITTQQQACQKLLQLAQDQALASYQDFALGNSCFVVVDTKAQVTQIFNDSHNTKPLYYTEAPMPLVSTSVTLLAKLTRAELAPASVMETLYTGYVLAPHTLWQGVAKLADLQLLSLQDGALSLQKQSSPKQSSFSEQGALPQARVIAELEQLLQDTCRHTLGHSKNNCLYFSGGNDSAALARLCQQGGIPLALITHIPQGGESIDGGHLEHLRQYGLEPEYFHTSPESIFAATEAALQCGEADVVGVNSQNAGIEYLLAQHIKAQGIQTCATGDHFLWQLKARVQELPNFARAYQEYGIHRVINEADLHSAHPEVQNALQLRLASHASWLADEPASFAKNRYQAYANATLMKLRSNSAPEVAYIFPAESQELSDYLNSLSYRQQFAQTRVGNQAWHSLVLEQLQKLLPKTQVPLQKSWLRSSFEQQFVQHIAKNMIESICSSDSVCHDYFSRDFLQNLDKQQDQLKSKRLFALYYLHCYTKSVRQGT